MFNIFNWGKTTSEIKRDEYYNLYQLLSKALIEYDKHISEANTAYCSYLNAVPNFSDSMIPSNDFDPKREELQGKLTGYFKNVVEKRTSIIAAKNKAYERYIHYKKTAIQEAEEEAKKQKMKNK